MLNQIDIDELLAKFSPENEKNVAKKMALNQAKEALDFLKSLLITEPVAETVADQVTEPVAEPVTEPVAETVTESVAEPVTEPITEQVKPIELVKPVVHYHTRVLPLRHAPTKRYFL